MRKLADYVEDAHATEQNDLKMIDSMSSTTDDPKVKRMLEDHRRETEEHERRMRKRLEAIGRGTSTRKQAQAVGAALLKGVGEKAKGDKARGDKAGKNARDGYTAEHMEIAAYQLLERLAEKAGDQETAEAARQNRADEEEMARRIDRSWDRTLELTLQENGIGVSKSHCLPRIEWAGIGYVPRRKTLARYSSKREKGDSMSEERPQHPQEPAEGAEEAEEAPGVQRAGDDDGGMQEDGEERSVEHPQEPAEGAEEAEEAPGADRAKEER